MTANTDPRLHKGYRIAVMKMNDGTFRASTHHDTIKPLFRDTEQGAVDALKQAIDGVTTP